MKNCLVTKLKGVVDNPHLPVYGFVELFIDTRGLSTDSVLVSKLIGGKNIDAGAYIVGDETFKDGTSVITENTTGNLLIEPNKQFGLMWPKYNAFPYCYNDENTLRVCPISMNLDDFIYLPTDISRTSTVMDLGDTQYTKKTGHFNDIVSGFFTGTKTIFIQNSDIYATLEQLGGKVGNLFEKLYITNCKNVSGSLESLVETILEAGKPSINSIVYNDNKTNITLNNKKYSTNANIYWGEDTVTIAETYAGHSNPLATYTISTGTWEYNY